MLSGSGEIPHHVLFFLDLISLPVLDKLLFDTLQSLDPQNFCRMTHIAVIMYGVFTVARLCV